jgi:sugar-specific transcriptional regulator TrmB
MTIQETLKNIGFEEHEITIYLYLIKKGISSRQDISDKTGILRQTVYDIMKKMLAKGNISVQ